MNKQKSNKSGFSTVELIFIGAGVLVILLIGWRVLLSTNSSASAQILSRQEYIDKYVSGINPTSKDANYYAHALYASGYLTSSLYGTVNEIINDGTSSSEYNNMVCVSLVPNKFTYGSVSLSPSNNSATLPVNVYQPYSETPVPYKAYWVYRSGTWQLNNISC